jgi:hypothetical protein
MIKRQMPAEWSGEEYGLPFPDGAPLTLQRRPAVYFGIGDPEQSRAGVWDYTSIFGAEVARFITDSMVLGPQAVKDTVAAFADIGADELIFSPGEGDLDEVTRLADTAL